MSNNKGFTLIELSIVMVIIGLIIGGILVGTELVHGAANRAIMSQALKYRSAVTSFAMKYQALPGDFATASNYIVGAVNGDGNSQIGNISSTDLSGTPTVTPSIEYGNFWHQLRAASLIEGSYSPVSVSTSSLAISTNFPAVKSNATAGFFAYYESSSSNGFVFNDNYFHLGATAANTGCTLVSGENFLSPSDAMAIDSKIDDGMPNSGIVLARGDQNINHPTGSIMVAPSVTGTSLTLASAQCITGPYSQYIAGEIYNTGASTSSGYCQLRINMN